MARVFDTARAGAGLLVLMALGCGGGQPPAGGASPSVAPVASASAPADSGTPLPRLGPSTITSRGKTPWKLDSEQVEYDDQRKAARVGRLTWSLLDEKGKAVVRVEGRGALVDIEKEKVTFEGPVDAFGAKGEVLRVNHLVWDGAKATFLGSEGVRVEREATVVTGRNLTASPDLGRMSVEGDVQVTMRNNPLDQAAGK